MAGGGAGLGGWEDGGRGGVGYALAPRDCPARARPPGGRGHAGGGARGAGRVFSRRVPSQVRLPPRRRVRAGSSPTPPPDRPRRASGRPVINLLGRALHDGHVTTRSTSPGQPRRSPMLNFATKTLQTGANGQGGRDFPFCPRSFEKAVMGRVWPGPKSDVDGPADAVAAVRARGLVAAARRPGSFKFDSPAVPPEHHQCAGRPQLDSEPCSALRHGSPAPADAAFLSARRRRVRRGGRHLTPRAPGERRKKCQKYCEF